MHWERKRKKFEEKLLKVNIDVDLFSFFSQPRDIFEEKHKFFYKFRMYWEKKRKSLKKNY